MTWEEMQLCPVCLENEGYFETLSDAVDVRCPRCGDFKITGTALSLFESTDEVSTDGGQPQLGGKGSRERANASAWVRANPGTLLNSLDVARLAKLEKPGALDRAERLLLNLEKATDFVGQNINVNQPEWYARAWATGREEVIGLAKLSQEMGWIEIGEWTSGPSGGQFPVWITGRGWAHLQQLRLRGCDSVQGFVAMSFSDDLRPVYDVAIAPAIRAAGYRPHLVSDREHTGKIDDEIMAQIRRSRFVIADYTEQKAGVYWEAGFAKGLGIKVIPTCRADDLSNLHFDIRQYNTLKWETTEDFKVALQYRIEAILGKGPAEGEEAT